MKVTGLVLAAGAGTRLGAPKALLRMGGRTLAERAVSVLSEGGCDPVVVVAGAQPLALDGARVVLNPDWETGMGSSLRAGLAALSTLSEVDIDAVVVVLVDMPGVTAEAVRRVAAKAATGALVMAGYDGRRGHPVLFGREHWTGIASMAIGDMGARAYLKTHEVEVVDCADVAGDEDIDTPEDARRWLDQA